MIDINWARENSKRDRYTERLIKKGMEELEGYIDREIRRACDKGQQYIDTSIRYGYINGTLIREEALEHVLEKYESAGYTVTQHEFNGSYDIGIIWEEDYRHVEY